MAHQEIIEIIDPGSRHCVVHLLFDSSSVCVPHSRDSVHDMIQRARNIPYVPLLNDDVHGRRRGGGGEVRLTTVR